MCGYYVEYGNAEKIVMTSNASHDVKKFVITSKTHMALKNTSGHQTYHHDVQKYVLT